MRFPLVITLLIVGAAAVMGWRDHQSLEIARAEHEALVSQATARGISSDPILSAGRMRSISGKREIREVGAALRAEEFAVFGKDFSGALEKMMTEGEFPDEVARTRFMDVAGRLRASAVEDLRTLASGLRSDPGIDDSIRQKLILFAMRVHAIESPHAALAIFSDSYDLFRNARMRETAITSPLRNWAMDDPVAAAGWVKESSIKHPGLVSEYAKRELIYGAACNDPGLAYRLVGELAFEEPVGGFKAVSRAARTSEERTASLIGLRDYLVSHPDAKSRAMANDVMVNFVVAAFGDGFETGSKWIKESELPREVLEKASDGLRIAVVIREHGGPDTGRWIEWVQTIRPETGDRIVADMVRQWARDDPRAAGTWLAGIGDFPARNVAIHAYAETAASREPESAIQWALTLPPGEDRDAILRRIYDNWPKDEPASKEAAEAFKKEHGIE